MNRKIISLIITLLLILSLLPGTTAAAGGAITVLYTNDVHCGIDAGLGYAGLAALELEALKSGYVTLVDAGDAIQGEALGSLTKGEYPIEIMNELGYDVAVPGNHEFDYGIARFMELSALLDCGYVCCNFVDLRTGLPVFDAYKIIDYGGIKVAYVGIDTPSAITSSTPTYFMDEDGEFIYGFCSGEGELYKAVQAAIDAARAEGANYVIAVGHCGIAEDDAPWRSTDIIANVEGLTAFIDGHSHSVIASQSVEDKDGKSVILTSTGTKLANAGKLVISADGTVTASLVSAEDYKEREPVIDAYIKGIQAESSALLDKVVARSEVDLTIMNALGTARAVRRQETNLGDLVADAYRAVCGADIGLANGGGVRVSIGAGDISYKQLISAQPFGNTICMVRATGQQVIDALEFGAQYVPNESGSFLQVSGLSFTLDTSDPTPVRLDETGMLASIEGAYRVRDVLVDGKPIDPAAYYTVASNDYLLKNSGGGCTVFSGCELLAASVMSDNEALIAYITEHLGGAVPAEYAVSQGRIALAGEPFEDVEPGDWYYDGVSYVYNEYILSGTSATTFTPSKALSANMLWAALARIYGEQIFGDGAFEAAEAWAAEQGLTELIAADAALSREALAYTLWLAAGSPEADFELSAYADAEDVSDFAAEAMEWAVSLGLICGTAEATLSPLALTSRAQAAAVLLRYVSVNA